MQHCISYKLSFLTLTFKNIMDSNVLYKTKDFSVNYDIIHDKKHNKLNLNEIVFDVSLTQNKDSKSDKLFLKSEITIRKALLKLLSIVQDMYKDSTSKRYYDINIGFDNLQKQFIKSGIFRINDKNGIYWLCNQINQISQSDDSLYFNNNFKCHFYIIKSMNPAGYIPNKMTKYISKKVKCGSLLNA